MRGSCKPGLKRGLQRWVARGMWCACVCCVARCSVNSKRNAINHFWTAYFEMRVLYGRLWVSKRVEAPSHIHSHPDITIQVNTHEYVEFL
jgi:hypothetical protein